MDIRVMVTVVVSEIDVIYSNATISNNNIMMGFKEEVIGGSNKARDKRVRM